MNNGGVRERTTIPFLLTNVDAIPELLDGGYGDYRHASILAAMTEGYSGHEGSSI